MALGFDWQFPGVGVSGWGGVGLRAFLGKGDVVGFVLPGQEKSVVMGFQDGWPISRDWVYLCCLDSHQFRSAVALVGSMGWVKGRGAGVGGGEGIEIGVALEWVWVQPLMVGVLDAIEPAKGLAAGMAGAGDGGAYGFGHDDFVQEGWRIGRR